MLHCDASSHSSLTPPPGCWKPKDPAVPGHLKSLRSATMLRDGCVSRPTPKAIVLTSRSPLSFLPSFLGVSPS